MKKILPIILILLFINIASAMHLQGNKTVSLVYKPNLQYQQTYRITNDDNAVYSYDIIIDDYEAYDLTEYFTITPDRFNNVPDNERKFFTITVNLPEKLRLIAKSTTTIKVNPISQNLDKLDAAAEITYIIRPSYYSYSVLPEIKTLGCKYIAVKDFTRKYDFDSINEYIVFVKSEYKYKIRQAFAEITFYDLQTDEKILDFRTNFIDIDPKHNAALKGNLNAVTLENKTYRIVIRLYYEGLMTYYEYDGNNTITTEYECDEIPETPEIIEPDCYGCLLDKECLSYGHRTVQNNISVYCASINEWNSQKAEGESCYNNFECLTNECVDSVCYRFKEEVIDNRNLLQKFFDWLSGLFK